MCTWAAMVTAQQHTLRDVRVFRGVPHCTWGSYPLVLEHRGLQRVQVDVQAQKIAQDQDTDLGRNCLPAVILLDGAERGGEGDQVAQFVVDD